MKYEIAYIKNEIVSIDNMEDLIDKVKEIKNKIDINPRKWSSIKKIIHEHEYIYTSPNPNKNIARFTPFSRSYFKLKEIINTYGILDNRENIDIFCIAEAPGGFIQCMLDYKDKIKNIYGTSLLSDDKNIPYWNKKLLDEKNINFEYGKKNNGDICDIGNILSLIKNKRNKYDIVTADGGFDYSSDYNNQERDSLKLIYSEIFLALNTQKKNGIFICKLFDIYLKETILLIYYLSISYETIHFHKPSVSRYSNSEKYIICSGFKGYNTEIINKLFRGLVNDFDHDYNYECDKNFIESIRSFNEYYLEKQVIKIDEGIRLFDKDICIYPSKNQIKSTLLWCKENNIEINSACCYLNGAISR